MTNRRKFLIGVGSLATGSAAAMGTGAFSQATAERDVDVAIVNDSSAFLAFALSTSNNSLENTEYASYENGQIQFHFNDDADVNGNGGQGLNPNATYDFDNVFRINNQSADHVKVNIDKSGLDHPDDITVYGATMGGSVYNRDSDWSGQINAGYGVNIGFRIETDGWTNENWETGSIVIEAYDPDDTSTPS